MCKMHKKLTALVLLTALCLTGCAGSANNNTSTNNSKVDVENVAFYKTEDVHISNPDEALNRLKEGNERFVNNKSELLNVTNERRDELIDGQTPYAVVISCSDSRVTPTTIFNVGLGEIFDIRIAGNVLDDDALGSVEYGVEHLHTPLVVVMGHESCGAVTAAYDKYKNGTEVEAHINSIVNKILPNIQETDSLDDAIHHNTDAVTEQIMENEIVKKFVDEGKVKVVEAYYSLDGTVEFK